MDYFYIITNKQKDENYETTKFIQQYLEQHEKVCKAEGEIPDNTECIIVLGGDGTMLQAARDTIEKEIPLLGVNLGTLGYLAEVEKGNLTSALDSLIRDEYEIEERMMLSGRVIHNKEVIEDTYALNDIVLARGGALQVIKYDIYVNGQLLKNYSADGVILATPTGSTGYSMSAGGPIVEPKARLIVVTPICPHTLNTRSIVLAAEDHIVIQVGEGKGGTIQKVGVNFDGQDSISLVTGDKVAITQSVKKTKIVKINKVSFLATLHKKMNE